MLTISCWGLSKGITGVARIRTIKPEFWTSEQVMECSTNARLLFIGLWNFCDDAGRHPLTPKQIKALIFPGDDFSAETIRNLIDELSSNGLLFIYAVEGKEYFQITGWQHQKIDRPQSPKYPAPVVDHSPNPRDGRDEGKDKGKEENSETNVSGAEAPQVVSFDARTALFREGLSALRSLTGKPDGPCRQLLGKWLKAAGDDARAVHGLIIRAADLNPADPVAWIEKGMRPRDIDAEIYRAVL